MQWIGSMMSLADDSAEGLSPTTPIIRSFPAGALVQYFSKSNGSWIAARVIAPPETGRLKGLYDLDCKAGVPPNKVRSMSLDEDSAVPTALLAARKVSISHPDLTATEQGMDREVTIADPCLLGASLSPPGCLLGASLTPADASRWRLGAPTPQAVRAGTAPLQLVRVQRQEGSWRFEVDEKALQLLESYGQRQVAICTVCGPSRSGKSFLMNRLAGLNSGDPQFGVGSTVYAHTEGLWLWGEANAEPTSSNEPALLYVDCEGFGSTDSDKTRDTKLMALCLLISSVFVLNTRGVLSESLFNTLSLVSHFADHIENTGQNMSHPGLLWVLRDFVLELQDDQGCELSSDEYLERALQAQPLAGIDAERSQAACEVRQNLLKSFPQRHCSTLVQPVILEERLRSLQTLPERVLRPEFLAELASVRAKVQDMARECPKLVAGCPVTGTILASLLRKFVDTLNSGQALSVKTAWEEVQHSVCAALIDELHGEAHARLDGICNGAPLASGRTLPVGKEELNRVFEELEQKVKAQWRARFLGDESISNEYYKDLAYRLALERDRLEQKNESLAEVEVNMAMDTWDAWLTPGKTSSEVKDPSALPRLLGRGLPEKTAARAACHALEKVQAAVEHRDKELRLAQMEVATLNEQLKAKKNPEADNASLKQRKAVPEAGPKNCTCQSIPFFGFRRQSHSNPDA